MSSGASPLVAPSTLMGLLWPSREDPRLTALRAAVLMLVGTALLTVSAKIQVPFYPVPMTLQTLAVLVLGAAYGWRLAGATVALYLLEGAAGLPVFAGPITGPAYLIGPTGGFLLGFLACALVTGFLAERGWDRSLAHIVVMMTLGHAVIFAFGLGWLSALTSFDKAWAVGFAPFAAATLLKTGLAVAIVHAGRSVLGRRSGSQS
jgi:biotin transport system substrate-specific component